MPPTPRTPAALSRRSLLTAGTGALALGAAGCGSGAGTTGREEIRFFQNKPEVIGYFGDLVAEFNASQGAVRAVHDSSQTALVPQFVRNEPPDLAAWNYTLEVGNYVSTGVLTDLSDLPEARRVDPKYQVLVDQFATNEGETNVLPYSVASAGVIYNVRLFEENGVSVPRTWSELITACETFRAAGVTPLYSTFQEVWTIQQGLFDYCTGSALDVAGFFADLRALGPDAGPEEAVSFSSVFADPVEKMLQFASYSNPDAASRAYADGNLAFGRGEAAMYLQGPWALGEIEKVDPTLPVGTFPLPMTEQPGEAAARVNLDLALWIPDASPHQAAARRFLQWLMSPEVIARYNADNLATSPVLDAAPLQDPRLVGLQPALDDGRIYQGANTYIPLTIPVGNYLQEAVRSGDGARLLRRIDEDWARLATRSAA
ncbi:ABC transporter substrate-binding protein [Kineococcus sp. SYSU DK018]|uniref:ABC transporter substrate-binding protein n=1 Tax=Kineococcus sp. SYSU DK018 TaxID=3383139 RepID=UPI003D7E66D1